MTPDKNVEMRGAKAAVQVPGKEEREKLREVFRNSSDSASHAIIVLLESLEQTEWEKQIADSLIDFEKKKVEMARADRDRLASALADAGRELEQVKGERDVALEKVAESNELWRVAIEGRDAATKFKTFVHSYLDQHGVPHGDPDNQHQKEGCRIGARLDLLFTERAGLSIEVEELRAERDALRAQVGEMKKCVEGDGELAGKSLGQIAHETYEQFDGFPGFWDKPDMTDRDKQCWQAVAKAVLAASSTA